MNKTLVKDLKKKRRAYLQKKIVSNVGAIFGICVLSGAVLAALATIGKFSAETSGVMMFALCVLIGVGLFGHSLFDFCVQRVAKLPYVPPVAEQIAALAAEEILVRGSDQPATAPDELLRATSRLNETATQELLRPEPTDGNLQQTTNGRAT